VTETLNNGTDTVRSAVTWTLGTHFEHLTLLGTGNINGLGNAGNNTLIGNSGNNQLTGQAGADTLVGGNGADIYRYSSGHGADVIDNSSTDTAQDRLVFTNYTRAQVTFTRQTNDLVITRTGTPGDNVRVTNWFSVTGNQLNFVQFTDQTLTAAQINALPGMSGASGLAASTTSIAVSHSADEMDLMLGRFVDTMHHFGTDDHRIVNGATANDTSFDELLAGSASASIGARDRMVRRDGAGSSATRWA
jgi:hypothetical protein